MRLDQALVARGLAESRTEAQEIIKKGGVLLNGTVITKATRDVHDSDSLSVLFSRKFVSRGGEKLEGAFVSIYKDLTKLSFKGKKALDVGSSTGGFSDCLLQYGIDHIDAVDVGSQQLHISLRSSPKISLFENTDIRTFKSEKRYDVIVLDVSFIGLKNIIDTVVSFGHNATEYFLLIKPQFEVGFGNTKKGIVRDLEKVNDILLSYTRLLKEKGFAIVTIDPCVIEGGDGNQEYFAYCSNRS